MKKLLIFRKYIWITRTILPRTHFEQTDCKNPNIKTFLNCHERYKNFASLILDSVFVVPQLAIHWKSNSHGRISASFYPLARFEIYVSEQTQKFEKMQRTIEPGQLLYLILTPQSVDTKYIYFVFFASCQNFNMKLPNCQIFFRFSKYFCVCSLTYISKLARG